MALTAMVSIVDKVIDTFLPFYLNPFIKKKSTQRFEHENENSLLVPYEASEELFFVAVSKNQLELLELYIRQGINVNCRDKSLYTPLHYAVIIQNVEAVKLLLKLEADVNTLDKSKKTPLHSAIFSRNVEIVDLLLRYGADTCIPNAQQLTPLNFAMLVKDAAIVELLLKYGAYFIIRSGKLISPLCCAIYQKSPELVRLLLEYDADPNWPNDEWPLMLAMCEKNTEVVRLLLEFGANPNIRNSYGRTPLHWASESTVEIVKLMVSYGAELDWRNNSGFTALHFAVYAGQIEIVKCLLDLGANPNLPSNAGYVALHRAIQSDAVEVAEELIERDVDLDYRLDDGNSFLHFAVAQGSEKIVKLLLEFSDVNNVNKDQKTALELSVALNNKNITEMLFKHAIKQNALGMHVSAQNKSSMSKFWKEEFQNYNIQCNQELQDMKKNVYKNYYISPFLVLTQSPKQISKYMRKNKIRLYLSNDNFIIPFPIFGNMLRVQIILALEEYKKTTEFYKIVDLIREDKNLPQVCVDKIVNFLHEE